jgi:mRNA interferase RelE/StbE
MKFDFSSDAMKVIDKLDSNTAGRIIKGILALPIKGDIKPIIGSDGSFRLRIGDYRIWFSCPEQNIILIEKILPRGDAYKGG